MIVRYCLGALLLISVPLLSGPTENEILERITKWDAISQDQKNEVLQDSNLYFQYTINYNRTVSSLHYAAYWGVTEVVEKILETQKSTRIDEPDSDGWTPNMWAAFAGKAEVVKYLLNQGSDYNKKASNGSKLIHFAAQAGLREIVKELIEAKGVDKDELGANNVTPLMWAAYAGEADVVDYLLSKDAEVNKKGSQGETALILAVQRDNNKDYQNDKNKIEKIVKALVDKGADPGMTASLNVSPLLNEGTVLNKKQQQEDAKAEGKLFNWWGRWTALHYASAAGLENVVELLMKKNAFVNDNGGSNALHWAAQNGRLEVVEKLLEYKPDLLNKKGLMGLTSLMFAVGKVHLEVVRYLVDKKKADITITNDKNETALDIIKKIKEYPKFPASRESDRKAIEDILIAASSSSVDLSSQLRTLSTSLGSLRTKLDELSAALSALKGKLKK